LTETEHLAPSSKPARAALSRELADFLIELSIALNKHGMYPDGHPSLEPAAGKVIERVAPLLEGGGLLALGVARRQLVIEGVATDANNPVLSDLAAKLHRHHLGAITFRPGLRSSELREALKLVAVEPDRTGDPLGLGPAERLTQWTNITLHPMSYGRLEMVDEVEDEEEMKLSADRMRGAQLWLGLARAAMAAEEAGGGSGDDEEEHDPEQVARVINERERNAAYDQVIVGYLLQIAEELRAGETHESSDLRQRMSKLVGGLDPDTLESLLSMGGDHTQRRRFLLNASEGMAADAVVELVQAASQSEEQTVSHSLLRVMQKLAKHAGKGSQRQRSEADSALRDQVRELITDWTLKDPNPDAYRTALARMSESESIFAVAPDQKYRPEPKRMIEMALEADVMGDAVGRAADELVASGELRWLIKTLETSGAQAVPDALFARLVTPEVIEPVVRADPIDTRLLDVLMPHATPEAAETLLDVLSDSDSSKTRRVLLERLPAFGRELGKRASARLTDNRWYVRRNMLKLIGDLEAGGADIDAEEFMKDEDPRVRLEALRILLARSQVREHAIGFAIGDRDDRVAVTGLRAALSDCPEGVIPRVASVAVSDRSDEVRTLAVRVLGRARHRVALKALLQLTAPRRKLLRAVLPPKTPVYLAALQELHHFEDEGANKVLARAAQSRDAQVVAAATATTVRDH
jgi:hypothetical protein